MLGPSGRISSSNESQRVFALRPRQITRSRSAPNNGYNNSYNNIGETFGRRHSLYTAPESFDSIHDMGIGGIGETTTGATTKTTQYQDYAIFSSSSSQMCPSQFRNTTSTQPDNVDDLTMEAAEDLWRMGSGGHVGHSTSNNNNHDIGIPSQRPMKKRTQKNNNKLPTRKRRKSHDEKDDYNNVMTNNRKDKIHDESPIRRSSRRRQKRSFDDESIDD